MPREEPLDIHLAPHRRGSAAHSHLTHPIVHSHMSPSQWPPRRQTPDVPDYRDYPSSLDRLVEGQGALGGLDVEVLDHPAVVGDHAAAGAVLPGLEDAAGLLDGLGGGGEGGVGALDLAGVDQGLAVEAHLPALLALGEEAVGVLHVVVDAVEDRDAGRAGGEQRQTTARSAAAARPGTCSANSSLTRSLVPITSTASRSEAVAISAALKHRVRRLDHRPELGVLGRSGHSIAVASPRTCVGRVHLGYDDRGRPGLGTRRRCRRRATRSRSR